MEDILQQGGQIALTALGSLAALFLLTKLSGNKQVSQMNLFDYVMGITIGSIAAEMASELESPLRPLWAMVVYGLAAWGIALLTNKSIRVRRFITGKPLILMDSGVIYRKTCGEPGWISTNFSCTAGYRGILTSTRSRPPF